jgi:hypothetical protein
MGTRAFVVPPQLQLTQHNTALLLKIAMRAGADLGFEVMFAPGVWGAVLRPLVDPGRSPWKLLDFRDFVGIQQISQIGIQDYYIYVIINGVKLIKLLKMYKVD